MRALIHPLSLGRDQLRALLGALAIPVIAIAVFMWLWSVGAARIQTSLGTVPGPVQVYDEARMLVQDHMNERTKEAEFYQRQEERNAKRLAEDPSAQVTVPQWTGKATFIDQIGTSLKRCSQGFSSPRWSPFRWESCADRVASFRPH
jgi:nitrate/nitrite transport system permease protein